ncbi:MAG: phosphopantothenate/pantothenate synthetase [Spirochaetales bacterium]|nr:phosphopantothenate/pantothenate synthetase [Spirochaetales bacterium]
MEIDIPESHPRAESLKTREMLIEGCKENVVAYAGLIAHGRGEAFDYLIGEKTIPSASRAVQAAAAALLAAKHAVISVNGNTAALTPGEIVKLSEVTGALIEVNLFYRTPEREEAIGKVLKKAGAGRILGIGSAASARIPELESERRRVDPGGIFIADVVLVPLEDGDRTEALVKLGKKVITIDLNPLSRTAQLSSISIIDNVVRAMPLMILEAGKLREKSYNDLCTIIKSYNNRKTLKKAISHIASRMNSLARKGVYIKLVS